MPTSALRSFSTACVLALAPLAQIAVRAVRDEQHTTRVAVAVARDDTQVYDVRDLLDASVRGRALPALPELGGGGGGVWQMRATQAPHASGEMREPRDRLMVRFVGPPDTAQGFEARHSACQALTRLVRAFALPPFVDGRDDVVAYPEPGILLVTAPRETQEWTRHFLERQRGPLRRVEMKIRVLDVEAGGLDKLGVTADGRVTLQPNEAERFLDRTKDFDADVLVAPPVVALERAVASVSTLQEVAFVKEYRFVTVQPGNQTIADPVIDTVNEGWSIEVLAAEVGERELGVDLSAKQLVVQRPIATQEVEIGAGMTATVSSPVTQSHELKTRFTLPIDALPYTDPPVSDPRAVAQVFELSSARKGREQAVVIQVWLREPKPEAPARDGEAPPATAPVESAPPPKSK